MRKIGLCLGGVFLIVLAMMPQTVFADTEPLTIRVGYTSGGGIVDDIGAADKVGYGYEALKKIEEACDLKFEFIEIGSNYLDYLDTIFQDLCSFFLSPLSVCQSASRSMSRGLKSEGRGKD